MIMATLSIEGHHVRNQEMIRERERERERISPGRNYCRASSGTDEVFYTRFELVEIRRRAMRKRVWFKVLSRAERGLVNLTIRCVDRIHSPKLAGIASAIVCKLKEATESVVLRLMREVGRPLAERLSKIAQSWGNGDAWAWVEDEAFIRYLTVMRIHEGAYFR